MWNFIFVSKEIKPVLHQEFEALKLTYPVLFGSIEKVILEFGYINDGRFLRTYLREKKGIVIPSKQGIRLMDIQDEVAFRHGIEKYVDNPSSESSRLTIQKILNAYEKYRVPLRKNMVGPRNFGECLGGFKRACKIAGVPLAIDNLLPTQMLDAVEKTFGITILREAKFEWSRSRTGRGYYAYDGLIEEKKWLIEIDGESHYKQVSNSYSLKDKQETDKYKDKIARLNGYEVIRFRLPAPYEQLVQLLELRGLKKLNEEVRIEKNYERAIRLVADFYGRTPTQAEYDYVRDNNILKDYKLPSSSSIRILYSWNDTLKRLGFKTYIEQLQEKVNEDRIMALQYVAHALGKTPSRKEYDDFIKQHSLDFPSSDCIKTSKYKWTGYLKLAGLEVGDRDKFSRPPVTKEEMKQAILKVVDFCGTCSKKTYNLYYKELGLPSYHCFRKFDFGKLKEELNLD